MKANNDNYPEILTEKESRRFWSKVNKDGPVVKLELGECWEWTASLSKNGYGKFSLKNATISAHRLVYTIKHGSISCDSEVDHLCRNRKCVKPDHLEAVPQTVNTLRGDGVTAINAAKTHCIRGHLLNEPNLRKAGIKNNKRHCLACDRAAGYIYKYGGDFQETSDRYYSKIIFERTN